MSITVIVQIVLASILAGIIAQEGTWIERQDVGKSYEYLFTNATLTCDAAQAYCRERLADLITIEDHHDDDFLRTESQRYTGRPQRVLLGLRREMGTRTFAWLSNSSATYRNWKEPQVIERLPILDCHCAYADFVLFPIDGQWTNTSCGPDGLNTTTFICQRPQDLCSLPVFRENCLDTGGSCTETNNTVTCTCPTFRTGRYCETWIDPCWSSPCVRGTCVHNVTEFKCQCPAGFSGQACQEIVITSSTSTAVSGTSSDVITTDANGSGDAATPDLDGGIGQFKDNITTAGPGGASDSGVRDSPAVIGLLSTMLVISLVMIVMLGIHMKSKQEVEGRSKSRARQVEVDEEEFSEEATGGYLPELAGAARPVEKQKAGNAADTRSASSWEDAHSLHQGVGGSLNDSVVNTLMDWGENLYRKESVVTTGGAVVAVSREDLDARWQ